MMGSSRILALIPARGGSKGVPRKNIRNVGGRPLIAWTIEAARSSHCVDRLILSSDDQEIRDVAISFGCEAPFVRPAELATDEADSLAVVLHALSALPESYDYLVLLQPTSPLRSREDIDKAIELCITSSAPSCVSICEAEKGPYWMFMLGAKGVMQPLFRADQIPHNRQDAPPFYALNGAVYVADIRHLMAGGSLFTENTVGYLMPRERSLDIDTEFDMKIADFLLKQNSNP